MKDEKKRTKRGQPLKELGCRTKKKLSGEILFILFVSAAIAVFFLFFVRSIAGTLVWHYCEVNEIVLTEMQEMNSDSLIQNGSLLASVLLFVALFLFLLGQKFAYLQVILDGIDALRIHRMDYQIPIEGENELTDLAKSINFLSETERELNAKEKLMRQEREQMIRALSHDIRTPLTTIRSYSEYMAEKEKISREEMTVYIDLMQRKAEQMKELTDQLLENSWHNPEWIEDGKLFMEQLASEWEEQLEDRYDCRIDTSGCPQFSGNIDIREFQRIFDNLYSNIEKYADENHPVEMTIGREEKRLFILQKNKKKEVPSVTDSHQIGLLSIRSIAGNYGGTTVVRQDDDEFEIRITLLEVPALEPQAGTSGKQTAE